MKASQSSLYRALENLYIWCLETSLRVPKTHALQHTAVQLLDEMGDALTACALALQTQSDDVKARLELIDVLIVHLTKVRTLTKVWFEWSSREGQSVRIISRKQHGTLLLLMENIGRQIGAWRAKTASKVS